MFLADKALIYWMLLSRGAVLRGAAPLPWGVLGPRAPQAEQLLQWMQMPRAAAVRYSIPDCQLQEGWFLEMPVECCGQAAWHSTVLLWLSHQSCLWDV